MTNATTRGSHSDVIASRRKAINHLKKTDPKLAAVIEHVGPCRFTLRTEGTHFDAVARAIVYQQLSGKAAATIHGRFTALLSGNTPVAAQLLALSDDALRGAGISRQKAGYLRDLAARVHGGGVPIDTLHELSDEEIVKTLTSIKGVGQWTAQMFLMFRLGRPDILPELDLGIQKGIQQAYGLRKLPTPERVRQIGAKWAPYRTVASWYLWRFLDGEAA
jgi:DNA-3-methyladenine glycosylase II